jgi:hypothetical protein
MAANRPKSFRYEIPASETEEGKARERAYHEALGRFIDRFSRAEATIEYVLRHYAKTGPRVAVVIFSGVRMEAAVTFIRKLAPDAAISTEARAHLLDMLQQLNVINGARNNLLHFGAESIAEGSGFVTNELKRARGKATVFPISPETLDQMTDDLKAIIIHLLLDHAGRPALSPNTRALLLASMPSAWRYKHAERPG